MKICIFDCDYDEGHDNTAERIKQTLKPYNTVIFKAKKNEFPGSLEDYDGFIITGSVKSLSDRLPWMDGLREIKRTKKPVLGICFGHQLIADMLGGSVKIMEHGQSFGYETIEFSSDGISNPLFEGIGNPLLAFSSHRYVVDTLPPDSVELARNSDGNQAFQSRNYYGIQFHPDITAQMAARLGKKRNKDPLFPGKNAAGKSWEMSKRILVNFAKIVEKSLI